MKPSKNIEKIIKNINIETNAQTDESVLDDVVRAFEASKVITTAATKLNIRRIIMESKITKVAAAVLLITGVIVGFSVFTGSSDMASVALGDVREAFIAQPWVHVIYDNGREEWMNLRESKHFYISESGWCFFVDRALNTRLEYSPNSDHILEVAPKTYPEGKVPPWEPGIAWEVALGFFAEGDSKALGQYTDIERYVDTLDGQDIVRFNIYYIDALDNRVLATQILADPESRLPIRIRSRLTLC